MGMNKYQIYSLVIYIVVAVLSVILVASFIWVKLYA